MSILWTNDDDEPLPDITVIESSAEYAAHLRRMADIYAQPQQPRLTPPSYERVQRPVRARTARYGPDNVDRFFALIWGATCVVTGMVIVILLVANLTRG